MRQIKFRYYVLYNNLMKYSDAFDDLVQFFAAYRQADRNDASPILMQHTGLKDSEGNCIYEGDIFKIHFGADNWKNCAVYFDSGCFWINDNPSELLYKHYPHFDLKVIGNIYQNPELLNEPQNANSGID